MAAPKTKAVATAGGGGVAFVALVDEKGMEQGRVTVVMLDSGSFQINMEIASGMRVAMIATGKMGEKSGQFQGPRSLV